MRKEVLISIILGVIFGGILSVLIISSSRKKTTVSLNNSQSVTRKIVQENAKSLNLQIQFPETNYISEKEVVSIKFKAPKNSYVLILAEKNQRLIKIEKEINEVDIPLMLGENLIGFYSFSSEKTQPLINKSIIVYYFGNE